MLTNNIKNSILEKLKQASLRSNREISGTELEARECIIYKATNIKNTRKIAIKSYRDPKNKPAEIQYKALEKFGCITKH